MHPACTLDACFKLANALTDLTRQFGRGFGADNLELMRLFYQSYPPGEISESVIRNSTTQTSRAKSESPVRKLSL